MRRLVGVAVMIVVVAATASAVTFAVSHRSLPRPVLDSFSGRIAAVNLGRTSVCVSDGAGSPRCGDVVAAQASLRPFTRGEDVRVVVVAVPPDAVNFSEEFILLAPR